MFGKKMNLKSLRQFAPMALVLLGAVIAVAAYMQGIDYPLISDDLIYLEDNTKLEELDVSGLWRIFIEPFNPAFEFLPLRDLSYWLDIKLFGQAPSVFHADNIFLYLLCLPLVYGATLGVWRYFRPADAANAPWAAASVTALFALHPALVESVVWISGRKYVLPNLFSMLALWLAIKARRERGISAPHAVAAMVAFVAVMLSKSSYVGVAPVIAMLWVMFWLDAPAPDRRRSQLLWPLAVLVLAGLMVRIFIEENKGFDSIPFYFGVEAVTRSLAALGWLIRLAVSPENRHFLYPAFEDPYLPVMVALGVAVIAAAVGMIILRRRSLEGFALIVFFLLCLPYMQLIPHAPPSLVSDRYLALAVWPAILLIVALSWRLKPASRIVLLLLIALPWGYQTIERTRDWRSSAALDDSDFHAYPGHYSPTLQKIMYSYLDRGMYREAVAAANNIKNPEARNAVSMLVSADYTLRIKNASDSEPDESVRLLQNLESVLRRAPEQIKWNPTMAYFWLNCKSMLAYQWVVLSRRFPNDELVRYYTGMWMVEAQQYKWTEVFLRVAVKSEKLPESLRGTAFRNLGFALMNLGGRVAEAEAPLLDALKQSPPDTQAYCLLSSVYKQAGRLEEAAGAEAECRRQAPRGMAQ